MLKLDGGIVALGVKMSNAGLTGRLTFEFEADEDEHAELVALMRTGVEIQIKARQAAMITTADLKQRETCPKCGVMDVLLSEHTCAPVPAAV